MTETLSKFLRYFVTGGIAAIVDAGGFALLFQSGFSTLAAAIISFLVATLVNFLLSSRYVFRHQASGLMYFQFLMAALGGLVFNVSITCLVAMFFEVDPRLAKAIGIGAAFPLNFALNLLFVFRKKL